MCRAVNTSQSSTVHTEETQAGTQSQKKPWYQQGYVPSHLGGCCFGHGEGDEHNPPPPPHVLRRLEDQREELDHP